MAIECPLVYTEVNSNQVCVKVEQTDMLSLAGIVIAQSQGHEYCHKQQSCNQSQFNIEAVLTLEDATTKVATLLAPRYLTISQLTSTSFAWHCG